MNIYYERTITELERVLFEVEDKFAFSTRHIEFEEPILYYIKVARLQGCEVFPIIDDLMLYINAVHRFGTLESLFVGICLLNNVKPSFYFQYLTGRNTDQIEHARKEAKHFMKFVTLSKY